jgi:hypothetical protein
MLLGVLASLVSVAFGSALFSLALILAALIVLSHLTQRPQLLYITVDRLRSPAPASIEHNAQGMTVCSVCVKPVRSDAAKCANCNAQFAKA